MSMEKDHEDASEKQSIKKRKRDDAGDDAKILKNENEGTITVWKLPAPDALPATIYTYFSPLLARFVDNFAPNPPSPCSTPSNPHFPTSGTFSYGTASALRVAGEVCVFSPLLKHAFIAASTLYFGYEIGDWRVVERSYRLYGVVLEHLRNALGNREQVRTEAVLGTVLVAMAYESMRDSGDDRALLAHCMGALQLIEFRGPYSHKYGIEHIIFTEILPYFVTAAIMIRRPTFLAQEEWKTIPWSGTGAEKDIMDALMGQMVDIPGLLYHADVLRSLAPHNVQNPSSSFLHKQARHWATITSLETGLLKWKEEWADHYPGAVYAQEFQSRELFPVFQYRDAYSGEIATPLPFIFPDPQLCRCLCFYYAAMILLYSVDTRPSPHPTPNPHNIHNIPHHQPPHQQKSHKPFAFALLICRSMKYFLDVVPGNMANRMLLPLSVARAAFPEGGVERAFVGAVVRIVEQKRKLNSWSRLMEMAGGSYAIRTR